MIHRAPEYVEKNEGYERYMYLDSEGIETNGLYTFLNAEDIH